MKYTVKWNNGYWKVFDNHYYADVSMHGLKIDAEKACLRMNQQR
jgi:hypothetical protein